MQNDEQQIRKLVSDWLAATRAGDVDAILELMADDAVFLLPGQEPMTKGGFATAARAASGEDAPAFDGASEIREIKVVGEWAFMWQKLRVVVTPPDRAEPMTRVGHTLTILRKQHGKWVLARDANLLVPADNG